MTTGAHVPPRPGSSDAQPLGPGADDVRPAEPLHGAHDTYEKGEVSSIGALVGDIATDLSTLVRQEIALAKAEATQSAKEAGKGAGMFGGAGLAGWFALLFLSIALWWGLGHTMHNHGYSAIVVGLLWAAVAAALALAGKKAMNNVNGMPRTVETAKQVPDALKGNEDHR